MCSTCVSNTLLQGADHLNNKCVTLGAFGYPPFMEPAATDANLSVGWSSVLPVRHASLKCSVIERVSD